MPGVEQVAGDIHFSVERIRNGVNHWNQSNWRIQDNQINANHPRYTDDDVAVNKHHKNGRTASGTD